MKSVSDKDWESIRAIFRFWVERGFINQTDNIIFFLLFISETKQVDMEYLGKLLEETEIDGGDIMLTLADRLRREGRQEGRLEGRQEGRLEGRQEGRLEGRQEEKLYTAKKLLKYGVSMDIILKTTGLTMKELENVTHQND